MLQKLTDYVFEQWAMRRPVSTVVKGELQTLKSLSFLRYLGRGVNGRGRSAWRSFHFAVVGTQWIVVVHDTLTGGTTWALFVNTAKRYSSEGRYASFPRFVEQVPVPLREQFEKQRHLFRDGSPPP
jgi:hypothetical protein